MENTVSDIERISDSAQETINFACELASRIELGAVIALKGDLGAGKTTFARGFARGLGISEPITSPTFTIVHEYDFEIAHRKGKLYHIDLYRLNTPEEAYAFGIDEILSDDNSIKLIEWPERLGEENFWGVFFEIEILYPEADARGERRIIKLRKKNNSY